MLKSKGIKKGERVNSLSFTETLGIIGRILIKIKYNKGLVVFHKHYNIYPLCVLIFNKRLHYKFLITVIFQKN